MAKLNKMRLQSSFLFTQNIIDSAFSDYIFLDRACQKEQDVYNQGRYEKQ